MKWKKNDEQIRRKENDNQNEKRNTLLALFSCFVFIWFVFFLLFRLCAFFSVFYQKTQSSCCMRCCRFFFWTDRREEKTRSGKSKLLLLLVHSISKMKRSMFKRKKKYIRVYLLLCKCSFIIYTYIEFLWSFSDLVVYISNTAFSLFSRYSISVRVHMRKKEKKI